MRARMPDRCGYAVRSGVRLYYEVFGDGPATALLRPTWAIAHSRTWKLQVPYLARLAASHPDRVAGAVFVGTTAKLAVTEPRCWVAPFDADRETDAETLIATETAPYLGDHRSPDRAAAAAETAALAARISCPCLVVHGDSDAIVGVDTATALAAVLRCPIEVFEGGGHLVHARHPVRFNLLLRRFVDGVAHARA